MRILAIDPGREKTGYALLLENQSVARRGIVPTPELPAVLEARLPEWNPGVVLLGNGTHSKAIQSRIAPILKKIPLRVVDEHDSTYRARKLYFEEHPPRGLWRFVPLGLQVPPEPYDDFAAVLIARRYLEKEGRAPIERAGPALVLALFALLAVRANAAWFPPHHAASKKVPLAGKDVTVHQEADQLEYDDKSKIMKLNGHVRLTQADIVLEADHAVYYLNTEEAEALGNLKLTRPDGVLTGHHLHLYYRQKRASVDGDVSLLHHPKKTGEVEETPVRVLADQLDYDWGAKVAVAHGHVTVSQSGRKAQADEGTYDEPNDQLTMNGHVNLFRPPKDQLACDHLVYSLKTNEAKAEGHVSGMFQVKDAKSAAPPPAKGTP